MPPLCNIDDRGKRLRLRLGLFTLFVGIVLCFAWALPHGGPLAWIVSAICLSGGVVLLYEARAGWCVLRALGLKTPV